MVEDCEGGRGPPRAVEPRKKKKKRKKKRRRKKKKTTKKKLDPGPKNGDQSFPIYSVPDDVH